MRAPLLFLLVLGCASGPALPEGPSPSLRVDRCRARTGLILTPDIAAPWEPASDWEGSQRVRGNMTILWCGEGTLRLEEMVGTWGNTEDGMTIFATTLEAVLDPNQEHIAPLLGTTTAEGAVTVHGHVGETLIHETAYVLVRPAVPPSEAARLCAAAGGHLRSRGLLGADACDLPTHDRGRPCDSDDRCEGVCVPHWEPVRHDAACPEGLTRYLVRGTCSETTLGPPCGTPIHTLTETCAGDYQYPPMPERCE